MDPSWVIWWGVCLEKLNIPRLSDFEEFLVGNYDGEVLG